MGKTVEQIDRLWDKAMQCVVKAQSNGSYLVISPSGGMYDVYLQGTDFRSCNCEYGLFNNYDGGGCCCHVIAAAKVKAEEKGYQVIWPVPQDYDWKKEGAAGIFYLGDGVNLMVAK